MHQTTARRLSVCFLLLVALVGALGAAITRIDFVPLAPVRLVRPSGIVIPYGLGAATDAARGTALVAAQTAAAAGDTIQFCGTATVTSSLGKNGVNYEIGAGSAIAASGTNVDLWADGGAAKTFTVLAPGADFSTSNGRVVALTHGSSQVTIKFQTMTSAGTAKAGAYVNNSATLALFGDKITSTSHDAIWNDGGHLQFDVKQLIGGNDGIEISGSTGSTYGTAHLYKGGTAGGAQSAGIHPIASAPIRLSAQDVVGLTSASATIAVLSTATDCTITAQTYTGQIVVHSGTLRLVGGRQSGVTGSNSAVELGQDFNGASTMLIAENCIFTSGPSATFSMINAGTGDETGPTYMQPVGVVLVDNTLDPDIDEWEPATGLVAVSNDDGYLFFNASAVRYGLGLQIGTHVQEADGDLTNLSLLSGTNTLYYRLVHETWAAVSFTAPVTFSGGALSVAAASTSAAGIAELATAAETTTGTDTVRTVTAHGLAHSNYGRRIATVLLPGTLATGDGQAPPFRVPTEMNGWNLVGVAGCVKTASSSGLPTFQVRRVRSGTPADMLSTALTLDASEVDSSTAATAAVINTSNDDLATADQIYLDCDTAGTGTVDAAVQLVFQLP